MTCPKTCAEAANLSITQELLDKDALPSKEACGYRERLDSVRRIKGKDVALVFVTNERSVRPTPYLKCACDFYFEAKEYGRLRHIDTYSCARKEALYHRRTKEVAREYNDKGMSPKEIILDIFDRAVFKGEFLGQRNGDWIYVQHVGEILAMLPPKVWGKTEYPLSKDSTFGEEARARRADTIAQLKKSCPTANWKPSSAVSRASLAASLALTYVVALCKEKKLGLDGMVLTPYREPPPEVPDETRTMMLVGGDANAGPPAFLVWYARCDERYHAEVQRIDRRQATLCLFDCGEGNKLLKTWRVGLSYGAEFGPDIDDVEEWQRTVAQYIDEMTAKHSKKEN